MYLNDLVFHIIRQAVQSGRATTKQDVLNANI